MKKEKCQFCDCPYAWSEDKVVGNQVNVKCGHCDNEFSFAYYGNCSKCGFYLDEDGNCELCEE